MDAIRRQIKAGHRCANAQNKPRRAGLRGVPGLVLVLGELAAGGKGVCQGGRGCWLAGEGRAVPPLNPPGDCQPRPYVP